MSWDDFSFFKDLQPHEFFLLFAAVFVAFWCAICALIARLSGWATLAQRYRFSDTFHGRKWRFRSAIFGSSGSYGGVLTVGADSQGLYLAVMPLFRVGHPPLFIPWQDVGKIVSEDVRNSTHRWYRSSDTPLELGSEHLVRVTFQGNMVAQLEAEAGREILSA